MFTGLKKQLELNDSLIEDIVPQDHDLVKLKKVVNWEGINRIYESCYPSRRGNATKRTGLVLVLLILKHLYKRPDRVLNNELHVNNAFMYFCSVSYDEIKRCNEEEKKIIDHSTLVKIRKRLGSRRVRKIEKLFMRELLSKKIIDGKYLFTDTTSLEKNILYPTEIGLLKRVIEEAEIIRQKVRYKKELVKTEVIKKANRIVKVYYSAARRSKELLGSCSKGLLTLAKEGIKRAEGTVHTVSTKVRGQVWERYKKLQRVGEKIVEQVERKLTGEKVLDKIVSYYEEHARALPKGKINKPCEFGVKLRIDMSGNGYITDHEIYKGNYADVNMLEDAVGQHAEVFKGKFKGGGMDRCFYDKGLIDRLEGKHKIKLAIPHRKDRNQKMTRYREKLYRKRAAIEAKISEGKRMCGLDKSLYKGFEGDEMWAAFSIMAMNIRQLLRDVNRTPRLIRKFA